MEDYLRSAESVFAVEGDHVGEARQDEDVGQAGYGSNPPKETQHTLNNSNSDNQFKPSLTQRKTQLKPLVTQTSNNSTFQTGKSENNIKKREK